MTDPTIVCSFERQLIAQIHNRDIVVDASSPFDVAHAAACVSEGNNLVAVRLRWNEALSALPFHESWKGIPLVVHAASFGEFRPIVQNMVLLRILRPRIFLSSDDVDSCTHLKCLASLGISCGLLFGDKPIVWESVNGLMHYAVYSRAKHAPVEPFHYGVSRYEPSAFTPLTGAYLDDPAQYVHIDEQLNVALTAHDLLSQSFVGNGVAATQSTALAGPLREHARRWQRHMLSRDACSFCPAFRLCGGHFAPVDAPAGCRAFFSDFLDAADFHRASRASAGANNTWQ
jgi:hypothetical protein